MSIEVHLWAIRPSYRFSFRRSFYSYFSYALLTNQSEKSVHRLCAISFASRQYYSKRIPQRFVMTAKDFQSYSSMDEVRRMVASPAALAALPPLAGRPSMLDTLGAWPAVAFLAMGTHGVPQEAAKVLA